MKKLLFFIFLSLFVFHDVQGVRVLVRAEYKQKSIKEKEAVFFDAQKKHALRNTVHAKNFKENKNTPFPFSPTWGDLLFYSKNQPYYEFTNYWRRPGKKALFYLDSTWWNSAEHYYQAKKFPKDSSLYNQIVNVYGANDARNIASKNSSQVLSSFHGNKWNIMYEAVRAKFSQNDDLKKMLLGTRDRVLVENAIGQGGRDPDPYWGVGFKEGDKYYGHLTSGLNNLGIILMKVRAELSGDKQVQGHPAENTWDAGKPVHKKADDYVVDESHSFSMKGKAVFVLGESETTLEAYKNQKAQEVIKHQGPKIWHQKKFDVLLEANLLKFEHSELLRKQLLQTGNKRIVVEKDVYWGIEGPEARNNLGIILMMVRDSLKRGLQDQQKSSTTGAASKALSDLAQALQTLSKNLSSLKGALQSLAPGS